MPSWLHHPRYVPVRDALIQRLRSPHYRFRRLNHVAFLCGKNQSPARDRLRDYLKRSYPDLLVFYAETVWAHIAGRTDLDALQMEAYLAALADIVIVIVESPGTFAELGAFSISDPLRKKLLPIVDVAHRGGHSFIETGPVRWVDSESVFRPTIWVPQLRILEAVDELGERLKRIPPSKTTHVTALASSPKHALFFLCDLVAVVQPTTYDILEYYMREIVGEPSVREVGSLLGLACAMNLVHNVSLPVGGAEEHFYWRQAAEGGLGKPYTHRRQLDLPNERARHISALQVIKDAQRALSAGG